MKNDVKFDLPFGVKALESFVEKIDLCESEVPRLRSTLWMPLQFDSNNSLNLHEKFKLNGNAKISYDHPFNAKVKSARYLTGDPHGVFANLSSRRVIHVEFDISNSKIEYEPGDAVGIRCSNPENWVEFVVERVKGTLPLNVGPETPFVHSLTSSPIPKLCNVTEALTFHLDLQSSPKKQVLRALAEHCEDDNEREKLMFLSSRTVGSKIYEKFVLSQGLTFVELLHFFPSCKPPAERLLTLLPRLPPRFYSVASSQLAGKNRLSIAFSVVSNVSESGIRRNGLCTTWLEKTLFGSNISEISVPIFLRPTKEFYLPGSDEWPCILVGPGTGVAPFIGFLEHKNERLKRQNGKNMEISSGCWRGGFDIENEELDPVEGEFQQRRNGETWLFFGCRSLEDWIFKEEMDFFSKVEGVLSRLECALSRTGPEKIYVQHLMEKNGKKLASLLLEKGAYLYLCGDGKTMAQQVHATLVRILVRHGPSLNEQKAEAVLREMKERRRYVLDVWS